MRQKQGINYGLSNNSFFNLRYNPLRFGRDDHYDSFILTNSIWYIAYGDKIKPNDFIKSKFSNHMPSALAELPVLASRSINPNVGSKPLTAYRLTVIRILQETQKSGLRKANSGVAHNGQARIGQDRIGQDRIGQARVGQALPKSNKMITAIVKTNTAMNLSLASLSIVVINLRQWRNGGNNA